jgi:hypothetical protein
MHDIVIGLFVNRYALGRAMYKMAISICRTLPDVELDVIGKLYVEQLRNKASEHEKS